MTIQEKQKFDLVNDVIRDSLCTLNAHIEFESNENCYFISFENDIFIKINIECI